VDDIEVVEQPVALQETVAQQSPVTTTHLIGTLRSGTVYRDFAAAHIAQFSTKLTAAEKIIWAT
jgi:hypothetical protein